MTDTHSQKYKNMCTGYIIKWNKIHTKLGCPACSISIHITPNSSTATYFHLPKSLFTAFLFLNLYTFTCQYPNHMLFTSEIILYPLFLNQETIPKLINFPVPNFLFFPHCAWLFSSMQELLRRANDLGQRNNSHLSAAQTFFSGVAQWRTARKNVSEVLESLAS